MPNKLDNGEQAMSPMAFEALAEEALATFSEIAGTSEQKLASDGQLSANSFASGNTLTGGQAYQNLININHANREAWAALRREPSIARLVLEKAGELVQKSDHGG